MIYRALMSMVLALALLAQPACGPTSTSENSPSNVTPPPGGGGTGEPPPDDPDGGQKGGGPKKKNTPPPLVLGNLQNFPAVGNFSYHHRVANGNTVIRYLNKNVPVTRNEFISLLTQADKDGEDFRVLVNRSIAGLPAPGPSYNGYQLQAPLINATTSTDPFYFVAYLDNAVGYFKADIFKNYLYNCQPKPFGAVQGANYVARFRGLYAANNNSPPKFTPIPFPVAILPPETRAQGAVIFKGGDPPTIDAQQIMVVPCPVIGDLDNPVNTFLGHIYTFANAVDNKLAKSQLLHSLWYTVGTAARRMFDGAQVKNIDGAALPPAPAPALYLNAHGHGIGYLHMRLETNPRYYHQIAALKDAAQSRDYYTAVFP